MATTITGTAGFGPLWWGQATGTAAAAQGEVSGIKWADKAIVVITGLTSETVSITAGLGNPGTQVYTLKLRPINLTTNAAATTSDLVNGSYEIKDLAFNSLSFTKSATTETPTITVVLKGMV